VRILFTSSPGWGHVHPMVPLARACVDRGDDVLWSASPEVSTSLEREGFNVMPAGLTQAESKKLFDERFPEFEAVPPSERPAFMFPRLFGTVRAGPMLKDLMPIAAKFVPGVVVHEAGELAGPIAAAALGVPSITHAFGGLVPIDRVSAASALVAPLWQSVGLEPRPYAGCYDHLYLDIYPPSLHAVGASHVPAVQPLRPVAFATEGSEQLPRWVARDEAKPLIYFTFGTVFNTDIAVLATIVNALGQHDVRVLVTLGPKGDPGLLGPLPDNVRVARYLPQTQVLPHVALVVSHGGSGTFLASLGHGIPQLCIPQAADQFANAAAAQRVGAGLTIAPGAVTHEGVNAAADRLLREPSFREAARDVKKDIEEMPGPDTVADIIESFLRNRTDSSLSKNP
jgi:UDP:flavonoid glycosyltransferase YjiC (YdhE family)